MPVWLRRFYIKMIQKSLKEEQDAYDASQGKNKGMARGPQLKT